MKRFFLLLGIVCLMAGLVVTPVSAKSIPRPPADNDDEYMEEAPAADEILADVLVLRPVGIVASIVGFAGAIVTLPFAATSESVDRVAKPLVQDPLDYTFRRPVGQDID